MENKTFDTRGIFVNPKRVNLRKCTRKMAPRNRFEINNEPKVQRVPEKGLQYTMEILIELKSWSFLAPQ